MRIKPANDQKIVLTEDLCSNVRVMKLLNKNKNKAKFEVMVSTKQPFRIYHFSRCSNLNYFQGALQEMKIFYMNQKICIFLSFTVAECCRSGFSTILVPALRSDIRGYCKYILYIDSIYWLVVSERPDITKVRNLHFQNVWMICCTFC